MTIVTLGQIRTLSLADLLAGGLVQVEGGSCGIVASGQLAHLVGDVVDCLLDSVGCCLCLVRHVCVCMSAAPTLPLWKNVTRST